MTTVRVPMGMMAQFRQHLQDQYLPTVADREGFIGYVLMEQVDDADIAQLIVLWQNQNAVEAFAKTGSLAASVNAFSAVITGVSVQRQSYIVTDQRGLAIANSAAQGASAVH
ncbi:MAG: antibiotic biosynthesis monooxygenase [bacterium]|nr:antibiotic biosynthesis monooxygenase [bacterium]